MDEKKRNNNYKYCVVPECKNTSLTAPDKVFITLPKDEKARKLWQQSMRRTDFLSSKSRKYCCEDHFNVRFFFNDLRGICVSFNTSKKTRLF